MGMKIYMGNCDKECSCCKKHFSLFFYSVREYVYKVKIGKTYIYQCSYPCYRKEKERYKHENRRNADKGPSPESSRLHE